ncbi:MAG: thioredoxin family protein [Parachlamydiales bacterium]|nr:thioredoxin family protein [Parachlamydiales bacterium]
MRKLIAILFIFFSFSALNAQNHQKEIFVYFFYGEGCYHCKKEEAFLEKLQKKYPDIKVEYLEVWENRQNKTLFENVAKRLQIKVLAFPITVIGNKYIVGFLDEKSTGQSIEMLYLETKKQNLPDIVKESLNNEDYSILIKNNKSHVPDVITLPIFGKINLKKISLPILTIMLGAVDGFNPCAMWALLMLLSFLIGIQNRKKLFFLGALFIFVSALVYLMFMVAWLNFLLFFSYLSWLKILIGLIAIIGGGFYLKEFFKNKEGVCKVTPGRIKQKISNKLFSLTENKKLYLAILGIIFLAFFVNLIELFCSAGIPVVYTQILSLAHLSTFEHYMYVLLYIFVFMLDDLLIFSLVVFTLKLTNFTNKYSRISHLIGGIVLLAIGFLLIFKPELLMF